MVQFVLFAILIVLTPFMVVTRYLQGAVNELSHLKWTILGVELPIVMSLALLLFLAVIIWQRREINRRRVSFSLLVVAMLIFSHQIQDFYAGFAIYDLQKNWHYAAYAIYVYIFFRTFIRRGLPKQKLILYSFLSALGLSVFDEVFQYFLSHRVFDVSDIAKDSWGAVMGLILVLFVSETYGSTPTKLTQIWQRNFRDYFTVPVTTLLIVSLFSFLMLVISPLLTDFDLIGYYLLTLFLVSLSTFFLLHKLQSQLFRKVIMIVFALGILGIGGSFLAQADQLVSYNRFGFTFYKGIPIPVFDLIIYPDGYPRLVDKKHFFNNQDKKFLLSCQPNILLIGSGYSSNGGKGFPVDEGSAFVYNKFTGRGTQVIVLPTSLACKEFNRLKREGKNVLFVIHTSC